MLTALLMLFHYWNITNLKANLLRKDLKSMEDDVICRFRYNEIILDVMPTDQKIFGFGNPWYKKALQHAVNHKIADDLIIKSISAPYFLATKFEAFKMRGNNDL